MAIPTGKVAVAAFLIEMNGQGSAFSSQEQENSCISIILLTPFPTDPKIRRSLIAVGAANIILSIPQILLAWFQCSPPNALWDPLRQDQCNHVTSVRYSYFIGAVAALSDFYLAIIPVTMLVPLRMDRKLKWGLSFLMGLGVFAGAAAIVRTWAAKFILSDDPSCEFLRNITISSSSEHITDSMRDQMVSESFSAGVKLKSGLSSSQCQFRPCGRSSGLSLSVSSNPLDILAARRITWHMISMLRGGISPQLARLPWSPPPFLFLLSRVHLVQLNLYVHRLRQTHILAMMKNSRKPLALF